MGEEFPLEGFVSWNNPFDLWRVINLMRGKIYEKYLIREKFKNLFKRKKETQFEDRIYQKMSKMYGLSFELMR